MYLLYWSTIDRKHDWIKAQTMDEVYAYMKEHSSELVGCEITVADNTYRKMKADLDTCIHDIECIRNLAENCYETNTERKKQAGY